MRAPGLAGQESPRQLVVASRAAFEGGDAAPDALVDRVVQAHVEVQERVIFEASPVAAVEAISPGDVEGAGNPLPVAARLDDLQHVGHALEHQVVEGAVQPAAAPHQLANRRAVQLVDRLGPLARRFGKLVAAHGTDGDALLLRSAALALDRVPILAAEARQEVLRSAVPLVAPVELEPHPQRQACLAQVARFVLGGEEDLKAGDAFPPAQGARAVGDPPHCLGSILSRSDEDAPAGARRERNRHAELRVIGQTGARGRPRPVPVTGEIPVRVLLHPGGGGRDEPAAPEEREVARRPSGPLGGAARALHRVDPVPTHEWSRGWIEQRIPILAGDLRETTQDLDSVLHQGRELAIPRGFSQRVVRCPFCQAGLGCYTAAHQDRPVGRTGGLCVLVGKR